MSRPGELTHPDAVSPTIIMSRARTALRKPGPWLVLGFFALAILLSRYTDSIGGPEALLARFGCGALGLLVLVQGGLSAAFFPSELFTLATSAAYGWVIGAVTTWLGWIVGSMIQYGLARRGAIDFALEEKKERLPAWLRRIPIGHPLFLIAGRWVPAGGHVVNIGAGVTGVPLGRQLWTATVGSLPGAIMWAGIGAATGAVG